MTRDFHLDTLFNPIWTDGPHVFTFNESVTIFGPKNIVTRNYASNAFRRPSRPASSAPAARTYADAVKAPPSSLLSRMRKPWKNATLTEQDDTEFEALMARSIAETSCSQQSPSNETKAESNKVCTWPPDLSAYRLEAQAKEPSEESRNSAPSTSYIVSPPNSQVSETESSVIPTPENRGEHMPFMVLHETSPYLEEELERVLVGVERLRRKALPAPLRLADNTKEESDDCMLLKEDAAISLSQEVRSFVHHLRIRSRSLGCQQALSPLTAAIPVRRVDLCV